MQTLLVSKKNKFLENVAVFSRDIKISHSIFALPFVGVALILTGIDGLSAAKVIKIILCMVTARSFAMGANRYLDREIDQSNKRTQSRALPSGSINPNLYLAITLAFALAFVLFAFSISNFVGFLAPVLLAVLAFYSLMKKISWLTHWYLGACLGLAPMAAELALFDRVTSPVVMVAVAVAAWTAGFDLLYALQDKDFDTTKGLHSVPAKLGHRAAIWMSRFSFLVMVLSLFVAGQLIGAGPVWYLGLLFVACMLSYEHWIIRDAMTTGHSPNINVAFFNLNALVSVTFFLFSLLEMYVRG